MILIRRKFIVHGCLRLVRRDSLPSLKAPPVPELRISTPEISLVFHTWNPAVRVQENDFVKLLELFLVYQ
jgi:hypothetical protein